eukprot:gnl/MRDRNA2_/MRDRNA2_90073_c0_seq1.p1 gnl/MRDRNA2_/MRDRNA2_90073_c0~~gnl/MRDRNA2_/MRDRNA2_90073_c0_seq1.p1  ORF type:complete len:299 (+),score=55.29 gnl/MRDRNA2_/MRDRNA2_90073_c0_seq1:83-898(+)
MGNVSGGEMVGHIITKCGCLEHVGFEKSAEAVIKTAQIEPWPARALIRQRLDDQAEIARKSPLRTIPAADGVNHFSGKLGGMKGLDRDRFLKIATNLCESHSVHLRGQEDQEILGSVYDSIDYDESETLSIGEWAGGLTVFFKGSQEEKTQAVFELIDQDNNGCLSKGELKEYLSPLVKAMTPPEAVSLRPLLIQHCVDEIMESVDLNHDDKVSHEEFSQWRSQNSVIDSLVQIIESEVYKIWLENNMAHPGDHHDKAVPDHHETKNSIFG